MGRNAIHVGLTAVAAVGLAACSSGSSDSNPIPNPDEMGSLTIGLVDTPVRDVAEVWVCITQINVKPESGAALEFPLTDADGDAGPCDGEQFDLLSLRDMANAELLIDSEEVPAGLYNWIELELDASRPGRGADADGPYDSYIVREDGTQHDLIMPSGSVRLVSGFTVTAGQHAQFTLDWDTQAGLSGIVDPPGQDGYILRPAFRIIDATAFGTLNGTITNEFIGDPANACNADDEMGANLDVGNVIYLFQSGETPDDIDEIAPNPYATVPVMPNGDATAYVYGTMVAPGDYVLAFTCQGDNDQPDVDDNNETDTAVVFHPEGGLAITITEGQTTTVDFPAVP